MSELSWLVDLLIRHKLSAKTKEHVVLRIEEIERLMGQSRVNTPAAQQLLRQNMVPLATINGAPQSASFIRAMSQHADVRIEGPIPEPASPEPPIEPVVVAATQATAKALMDRQTAILASHAAGPFNGKPEAGRTSPRKF